MVHRPIVQVQSHGRQRRRRIDGEAERLILLIAQQPIIGGNLPFVMDFLVRGVLPLLAYEQGELRNKCRVAYICRALSHCAIAFRLR